MSFRKNSQRTIYAKMENTRRSNLNYANYMIAEINRLLAGGFISREFANEFTRKYAAIAAKNSPYGRG